MGSIGLTRPGIAQPCKDPVLDSSAGQGKQKGGKEAKGGTAEAGLSPSKDKDTTDRPGKLRMRTGSQRAEHNILPRLAGPTWVSHEAWGEGKELF